jgi:hypothetical protein
MGNSDFTTNKLPEAGRELPFRIPRQYFDDFPSRLQSRIDHESHSGRAKILRFTDYLKPALGLAAAFAAVFLLVYWPAHMITNQVAISKNAINNNLEEKVINLVEHVDDRTFFSLLENDATTEKINNQELEKFIAANYSDYDIYLETRK